MSICDVVVFFVYVWNVWMSCDSIGLWKVFDDDDDDDEENDEGRR